jgi:hypothetical protein
MHLLFKYCCKLREVMHGKANTVCSVDHRYLIGTVKLRKPSERLVFYEELSIRRLPILLLNTRETREGWPLLTVETEAYENSNERGPSLIGSLSLLCRYKRFLSCLCCSCQPSSKCFFFLIAHYFTSYSPSPRKLGRHSFRVACLLLFASAEYSQSVCGRAFLGLHIGNTPIY